MEQENLLHFVGSEESVWSSANSGEAMPGSLTPLNWTLFGDVAERSIRQGFWKIGVLPKSEVHVPKDRGQRALGIFYGHAALNVDFLCEMGRRTPGMTGSEIAMQLLGTVPPSLPSGSKVQYYPTIALRMPWLWLTLKRDLRRLTRTVSTAWWQESVQRAPELDFPQAMALFRQAYQYFLDANLIQTPSVVGAIQPAFEALNKLISKAGMDELRGDLMAGYGSHEESAMVYDMWSVSRGRMTEAEFLQKHGYHGPREGEISGQVWREDPKPLQRLIDGYQRLDEEEDPARLDSEKITLRRAAEAKLLQALPAWQRPGAEMVMRVANYFVPMRGIAKMAFLRAMDVQRACARRLGQCLSADGVLKNPDDVFYLTFEELTGEIPGNAQELVAERRQLVTRYAEVTLPRWWQGQPEPISNDQSVISEQVVFKGIGASPGIVEGVVQVVTNPDFVDVPDDCILVAPTTDPSWVPIMYLSKALVVDIGGALSHAAVVARELGIPCVVGTDDGSRSLRSGDYCRVDGSQGTVEILKRFSEE